MSKNTVTHPGFIKVIEPDKVEVTIVSVSGCASCQIKGSCSVSDTQVKSVWIHLDDTSSYRMGQEVIVVMSQTLGTWAVLLGYVFPFIVLLIGLIVFIESGLDQGLAGLLAVGLLLPYYGVLYLMRNWLGKRFTYTLLDK
ncbi:MAG: SoxR reducing system RseC family protein [Bacteroidales bacterium]|nr:SoxR reducing system RseC family protein [Bacteroidales bacterium]